MHQKGRVKNIPNTKIEASYNKIERLKGLDDLARTLFPDNRNHQRIFLAIFIELKYAKGEFIPYLAPLCDKYSFTPRMLETVRSKMRRLGVIDHVSRFNNTHGYREGWVFSTRFSHALLRLADLSRGLREKTDGHQEQKDRDLFMYV